MGQTLLGAKCYPQTSHSRALFHLSCDQPLADSLVSASQGPNPVFGTMQACGQYLLNI